MYPRNPRWLLWVIVFVKRRMPRHFKVVDVSRSNQTRERHAYKLRGGAVSGAISRVIFSWGVVEVLAHRRCDSLIDGRIWRSVYSLNYQLNKIILIIHSALLLTLIAKYGHLLTINVNEEMDMDEFKPTMLKDDEEIFEGEFEDDDDDDELSSQMSIPDDNIDYSLVYALHTFLATVEGQASVVRGDSLVLLDDSNAYWWLIRVLKTQELGYIPAENIETPDERLARLNKHRNIDVRWPLFASVSLLICIR